MVVVADLSLMSRAEVERIWLPFVPWLLVGCALLPDRWRRWGLGSRRWPRCCCSTSSARSGDAPVPLRSRSGSVAKREPVREGPAR